MADNPTHMVVIETADGDELRRQGPMNLGRAYKVKHRWENSPQMLGDPADEFVQRFILAQRSLLADGMAAP